MARPRPEAPLGVLGVDTGGTFTDFVLHVWWPDGSTPPLTLTHKVLSTPHDPAAAVVQGLRELLTRWEGTPLPRITLIHGSTVATNALLERKGAKTALVTTRGFEDLLLIGRQTRRNLYDLAPRPRDPLIPPERTVGATERIAADGSVLTPLGAEEIERVVRAVAATGAESAAVCLLFSFLSPDHERRLAAALREAGLFVSASHEVLPEHREYERAATTAVNAYVAPLMRRYLARLEEAVSSLGVARLHVMQASGGCTTPGHAGDHAVHTVLSGPAGGVTGAFAAAQAAGRRYVITFDMGGTSTDVALVPGRLPTTTESEIDGLPIRVPTLAIHTVGAGGGSIAFLDAGGALCVGPQSAGAVPGPACYGRGGTAPTVTDAHVVLGRLPTSLFLGGRMPLDAAAAEQAVAQLARQLGASADETAWSILQVANAQMERAIRVVSVEKGYDPAEFTLVAFGGAGGLHAADLARSLEIPEVLVPPHTGLLSAWGMATADVVKTASQGVIGPLEEKLPEALGALDVLVRRLVEELRSQAHVDGKVYVRTAADLRYAGQSFELSVDLDEAVWDAAAPALPPATADAAELAARFHGLHRLRYGYAAEEPVEIVAVRVRAWCRGPAHLAPPARSAEAPPGGTPHPAFVSRAYIDGAWHDVPVYKRSSLPPCTIPGPAVIADDHATVVVGTADEAVRDERGYIRIRVNRRATPQDNAGRRPE